MNNMQTEVLLVFTNLPDRTTAEHVARALIEQQAAACVNILHGCTSLYCWEGQLETGDEVQLLAKTTHSAYMRLEQIIRKLHPYELPEIIAVPVSAGLPEYMDWVVQETRGK